MLEEALQREEKYLEREVQCWLRREEREEEICLSFSESISEEKLESQSEK